DRVVTVGIGLGPWRRPARQPPLSFVEGNSVEPARELCPLLEPRKAAPGAHEHLLRHRIRLARIETEAPECAINALGVHGDQLRECVLVAVPRSADQLTLRVQAA